MDSSPTPSSILDTLRTVEFRLGLKGYNVDEVDEYLDRAAQEAEALQETVRQINERLRQAGDRIVQLETEVREGAAAVAAAAAAPMPATSEIAPPTPPPAPVPAVVTAPPPAAEIGPSEETLQRTLLLAQKFVDQIKRESESEAATIVTHAEETARAALAAAEHAAMTLQTESQRQVREEVARLESTRTELAADVESMARHLESERDRLRDALTEILKWVDENVQPTNALMGVRSTPAPKPAPAAAIGPTEAPVRAPVEVDEQPTLNLEGAADPAESGASRTN